MMKRVKNQSGFTLVELVIVISIIGVLAAIIIPSILNYVHRACRADDKVTARLIGTTAMQLLVEDPDFADFFYSDDTATMIWDAKIEGQHYYFVSVARADGSKACYQKDVTETKDNNKKSGAGWEFSSYKSNNKEIVKKLNNRLDEVIGGDIKLMSYIPMRSTGYKHPASDCNHDTTYSNSNEKGKKRAASPTYSYTDKWIIGYNGGPATKGNACNLKNKDMSKGQIEVWAGDSYGKGANGPRVRLWPSPPSYY
ncbi:prepilin-type N-terminal cleavage/methylation domain-containing protein [Ruminococcus sp. YE71]|uniref:type II secretion system protein n=1 Tax=unclassified Ruminococcus TaxID=2608920 RepID=UPI000881227E|nr:MULTISPECIES: prepilin-type N-terminal cleavage/methylation domain-containing protein [unclassified Ruminococcus]SDA27726.1 prepilin-type N-terminal cleavage/methylation domain-containing protein [Ruminococcus sp. YE78]SFW46000.1 prepilin-type N-terminal cleavage/methylation domain-containing protein [Ruminococcus sp. YE71]